MQLVNFSNYKFSKMQKYHLPNNITNTECELFFLPSKEKWGKTTKLFKKFYIDSGEYFGNKLLTINSLISNKDKINIEELVFPEALVSINDTICGYMMPFIDSVNLGTILSDSEVSIKQKIELLKKVGTILEKVSNAREHTKNFCLGDIHENNFVVEKETNNVFAVDLDSCSIGNNEPFPSRYLQAIGRKRFASLKKYNENEDGVFIPDYNTELLCYNVMILNLIGKKEITSLTVEEFYYYLEYLKSIGFDGKLIDCFEKIYSNQDNVSPLCYLDSIPDNISRAAINVFKSKNFTLKKNQI